ncbi:MAG: glycoside hydrolase family 3 C-terminal domain-containing protein [Prolixibacteraceae bacterium]|nr:glycoside hydrolase family 3 C-terminal domain-containing protein [Prolixibacteraceae bacterium]
MFKNFQLIVLGLLSFVASAFSQTPVYLDVNKPIENRVEDALSRMTLKEKVAMIHAQSKFSSAGVPRLGIPENWMSDGPHGIRQEVLWDEWNGADWTNDSCTAFPALTCLSATWNPEMSALYGKSIGEEARYRNKNVLLGPGVNIYRTPLNGRNFEYFGEDPYLTSQMVVPYIKGVQSNGVASCVKHYVLNNQEKWRGHINVIVNDRAFHEIYLAPFKAAVQKGGCWAIMGSYNQYKHQHCCHNQYTINQILKHDWDFDGVVISDWGGVHNTEQAIHNGLDMEFGTGTNGMNLGKKNAYNYYYLANPYLKLIKEEKVGTTELNDKVRRVLRLVFRTTMSKNRPLGSFGTKEHAMAGREIAQEGIVLLQNNSLKKTGKILPVDLNKIKNILVVGENAVKRMTIGGGSSSLKAKYEISPLEGIKDLVGNKAKITYAPGYQSPTHAEQDKVGAKAPKQKKISPEILRAEAVTAAKDADVVLYIGGLNKNSFQDSEGSDRTTMDLPYDQNKLISALIEANPRLAVIILSGNAVSMPWVNKVPAILEAWYDGTEAGNAIASILFGEINPSGKLPFTFPVKLQDNGAIALNAYPGDSINEEYKEGIFVGYRWADKENIEPLFAFGHGLSYTTFKYGKPTADKKTMTIDGTITFTVNVKNTGNRKGKEVVQLYISDLKSTLPRPVKELKGFKKIELAPDEEKTVSITINKDALSYYNDIKQEWVAEPGKFIALIGSSSRNIKGKVPFELK